MANKFPLILNTSANQIQELASGDNLDLTGSGIHNAGVITATSFSGNITGGVTGNVTGTADLATSVTVTANNSTDETVYPIFVDGATGTQGAESDTGLTYNPSSGNLTSTQFTGTLQTAAQPNITSVGTLSALNVSGNVSIGGTLTYEDVTNIDAVGLITARNGITVSAGTATFQGAIDANSDLDVDGHTNLDNVSVAGVTTFTGAATLNGNTTFGADVTFGGASSATALVWDKADDDLKLAAATQLHIGDSSEFKAYRSGTHTYLAHTNSNGNFFIKSQANIALQAGGSTTGINVNGNGEVTLTNSGDIKLATTATGINITGICTATDFSGAGGSAADFPNGLTGTTATLSGTLSAGFGVFFQSTGQSTARIGSGNAGGAALVLDGDSDGDGGGGDYAFIRHNTSGNLDIAADNPNNNSQIKFYTSDAATLALTLAGANATFAGQVTATRVDSNGQLHVAYPNATNTNYMSSLSNNNGIMHLFRGDGLYIGNNMNTSNQAGGPNNKAITLGTNGTIQTTGTITCTTASASDAIVIQNSSGLKLCVDTAKTVSMDARSNSGSAAILHKWNSPNLAGGSYEPYEEAWYDGNSYHSIKSANNQFEFDSDLQTTGNSAKFRAIESGGATVEIRCGGSEGYVGTQTNHKVTFTCNSNRRMQLLTDGDLLIGDKGNTGNTNANGGDIGWVMSDGWTKMVCSGDVGGNTPWTLYNKHSSYNRYMAYVRFDGGFMNHQSNDGNLCDERIKQDFGTVSSQWNNIKNIGLKTFRYKSEPSDSKLKIGVIAQQVETIYPDLVEEDWPIGDADPNTHQKNSGEFYKSVKEEQLQMYTLKALQEAMARIETLEAEVAALKSS